MRIISWDVGIIHLAYCVIDYDGDTNPPKITIVDWDEINLIEDDRIKLECCGFKADGKSVCGKNAGYYMVAKDKSYGFCKTHLSQHSKYWSKKKTERMFSEYSGDKKCGFVKKSGSECGVKAKYDFNSEKHFCNAHYKSELNKKIKEHSPQPIKNLMVKKYPTAKLQLNLIKRLDDLSERFAGLCIEEVVIENQPSHKNPKMKSISNTLFDYFMIRGYIDKINGLDISLVRFMCPSNKLKVNNDNTIEIFKANKDKKKKYKLTKELGIKYTRQLLDNEPELLEYLDLFKKKDDLCDAYLQGRYYLEFLKFPKKVSKKKCKVDDDVVNI